MRAQWPSRRSRDSTIELHALSGDALDAETPRRDAHGGPVGGRGAPASLSIYIRGRIRLLHLESEVLLTDTMDRHGSERFRFPDPGPVGARTVRWPRTSV